MSLDIIILFIITIIGLVLFISEIISPDVTAFCIMVTLMLTNILTPAEGLSGFSNPGTLSVFGLLFLAIGFQSTGVVSYISDKLESLTTKSETRNISVISVIVGFFSAFLNNTAIVAIAMPAIINLSKYHKISASKLLMPMSFAAMVGGTVTIIGTSTNVIVSSIYQERFGKEFEVFEFALIGIILFIAYLIYMLVLGHRLIPSRKGKQSLAKDYKIGQYITEVLVTSNSKLVGKAIEELQLNEKYGIDILEILRDTGEEVWVPQDDTILQFGDSLIIKSRISDLLEFKRKEGIVINKKRKLDDKDLISEEAILVEAVIGRNSFLIDQKIGDVNFMNMFHAVPLAVRRSEETTVSKLSENKIQFGDTILFEARRNKLEQFYNSPDFIVLEKIKKSNERRDKMLLSGIIILEVICLAAMGILPLVTASFVGSALLLLTNCVSISYVYRKMEWRVIFLLAGLIPLGIAYEKTGASHLIAHQIIDVCQDFGPVFILSFLFIVTVVLTSFMSNNATAILLAPIAISIALELQVSPKAFLLTVMLGASTSFITPIGYQTNTLIYGPGQYKFLDFMRVGGILTLIFWVLVTFLIPYLYF